MTQHVTLTMAAAPGQTKNMEPFQDALSCGSVLRRHESDNHPTPSLKLVGWRSISHLQVVRLTGDARPTHVKLPFVGHHKINKNQATLQ